MVFALPLFLAEFGSIIRQVEGLKQKDPVEFTKKNAAKRLAAIAKLALEVIPQDPSRADYRQGNTLGDEDTKRTYESSDDAYPVFRKMLENGHPPDDWDQLLTEARTESDRLQRITAGVAQVQV